ncbi:hypothetical protein O3M35_003918 [Rhynocoris fuscipes]|uniref:protein-tyrosine-phosphatase n=1 Tax=Rhynocoris fuscipes TaxID=488301 RepID=A0AAW1CMI3_9HEMI
MKDEERPPLRVVLRNFLNHIENLESQISPDKSYDIEFQALKLFSESVKGLKEYSCLEGEKEINRKKNRYKDILPFDVSRVVLQENNGIPGSDYINANYIKGASGSPAYIASQGPLPCTVNDFWRMVVQCEVHVIVMACNQEEAGKAKCEKYWVDEGEERQFGRISVRLLKSSTVCPDFSVRTMRLKYSNGTSMVTEERTVCQVHYVAWPDHGVPSVVHPLLDMVRLVRDTQASETLPVLVHCSAGCGRTGTICAIDYVFGLLRTGKLTADFSLSSLIRDMRRQRIAMVQTKEQYVLVHQAVRELFREQLSVIDSHPYENVDPDGSLLIKIDPENIYDTIDCTEEKGDFKMEKDSTVSSFPGRKNFTIYSSKQEKEVENLTEQLRSVQAGHKQQRNLASVSNTSAKSSSTHQPINKSSHQQVFARKKENFSVKPIPARGILRVPLLPCSGANGITTSSTSVPVKRSKSLKIMPAQRERILSTKLTVPPSDSEIRQSTSHSSTSNVKNSTKTSQRRSSLELVTTNTDTTLPLVVNLNETHRSREDGSSVSKKYDAVSGKKLLMRSYTTLDMRHKLAASLADRKPYVSQALDLRSGMPPWNVTHTKTNSREPNYGVQQFFQNIRPSENSKMLIYGNSALHSESSQPGAARYGAMVRQRISQPNPHYSSISDTSNTQQQFQESNHSKPPPMKSFQNVQSSYIEKTKISRKSREPKTGEIVYDGTRDYADKCKYGASDLYGHHVYDPRLPLQSPPNVAPKVAIYHPPLPPRNHPPVASSGSRDTFFENSNFATAPGVDIDEVAASIPNKDESKSNLMKVALEAFQTKKTKQNKQNDHVGAHSSYSPAKRKQQQYL